MLVLSSPSKTQNFDEWKSEIVSKPEFLDDAKYLVSKLAKMTKKDLETTLRVNDSLTKLNYKRYREWSPNHTKTNSKPAILAFQGDVFREIENAKFTKSQNEYMQKNFRIISGLYGLLKPFDLIQAYRLEMKVKLQTIDGNDLYEYWKEKLTEHLEYEIEDNNIKYVANLASNEYSKAIRLRKLKAKVINFEFRQIKSGKEENIGIYSKKARGAMVNYILKNKIKKPELLQDFKDLGYKFIKQEGSSLHFETKV